MPDDRAAFLQSAYAAAKASGHIWPIYATIEAALDSDFGTTELAQKANNVFNLRAPMRYSSYMQGSIYVSEVNGKQYDWLKFGTLTDCFAARMGKLRQFNMYYQAVRAKTGPEYAAQISRMWSTDPARRDKIMALVPVLSSAVEAVNV